jgi:hypothetical protein
METERSIIVQRIVLFFMSCWYKTGVDRSLEVLFFSLPFVENEFFGDSMV